MFTRNRLLISLSVSMTVLLSSPVYAYSEIDSTNAKDIKTSSYEEKDEISKPISEVDTNKTKTAVIESKHKKKRSKPYPFSFLFHKKKIYVNQVPVEKLIGPDAETLEVQQAATFQKNRTPLHGSLTYMNLSAGFGQGTSELSLIALKKQPRYMEAARAVKHYRTKVQRTIRFAKDAFNYAIPYRGFSMSIEGSRVVLDIPQKLNNLFVAELTQQKYIDEMHSKIAMRIMQIATGLGIQDPEASQREVDRGVSELEKLVGNEEAQNVKDELVSWYNQLNVADSAFQQQPWDVDTSARIYQNALVQAADGDPLVYDICNRVKKYIHGKLFNFTAGAVESTLSAMTIMSGNSLISLGAEAANTGFVMSTGGPEENKILNDLYFGRRLEIRRKRISDEVQLALTNYEKSQFTHNRAQLALSELLLAQIIGSDRLADILERDPVSDIEYSAPVELAKMVSK